MSENQDLQNNNNQNLGQNEISENDQLYQKRPVTSYAQNEQQGRIHFNSSSGFQNYSSSNIHNQRSNLTSAKFSQGLKTNRSGYIRPSTGTQSGVYDQSINHSSVKNQKMPQILTNESGVFFGEKGNKKVPSNIMHDKEHLYEQQFQLRNTINMLQEENMKLKTKNLNLERQAKKFERIIEEGNMKPAETVNQQKENALSIRLRKQLKESLKDIEQKNNEFDNFKKQMTTTRLQELEIEVNVLSEECIKLKSKLDQCLKLNHRLGFDQPGINKVIEILKNDNVELAVLIQKLEKEKNEINAREREADKQLKKLQKEKFYMEKRLQQQEDDLTKLRMEGVNSNGKKGQNANQNNGLVESNSKLKSDLEKIVKENNKLNTQLIGKIDRVKELEEKQRRENQEWQERIESIRIQKELAERNYNQELLANKHLEDRVRNLEAENQQQHSAEQSKINSETSVKHKKTDSNEANQQSRGQQQQYSSFHQQKGDQTQSHQAISNNDSQKSDNRQAQSTLNLPSNQQSRSNSKRPSELIQKKMLPRVNQYDVNKIGKDLRFSLKTKKIRFEEIDNHLITPDLRKKGKASIQEIINVLQKEPFCLENDEDALTVARYTIEDNSEDKIVFDEQRSNDISIIKSVFRNLIGNYEILNAKDEVQIHGDITDIFTKFSAGLKENIQLYTKQKKENVEDGICKFEDLEKAMSYCDAEFSPRHTDYIIMKIYEDSKDTDRVYYDKLLQTFEQKEFEKFKNQRQKDIERDEVIEHQKSLKIKLNDDDDESQKHENNDDEEYEKDNQDEENQ